MRPQLHFNIVLVIAACLSFSLAKAQQRISAACGEKSAAAVANCQVRVNLPELDAEITLAPLPAVQVEVNVNEMPYLSYAEVQSSPDPIQAPSQTEPRQTGATTSTADESSQQPSALTSEKLKEVNRTFKVKSTDKLSIENQFGKVDVQTWNRNEINVQVQIISRAASDSKAQEILDKINVRVLEGGNVISFVTEREPMHIRSSTQKSFEINYLVKMPKANPLQVNNKYGPVVVPSLDGPAELSVKYGTLTTGSLNNRSNKVQIAYSGGECVLDYMKGGELEVKYSTLKLGGGEIIKANTAYSKVNIEKVEELAVESRYDQAFKVGNVNQVSGSGSYTSFYIHNLAESIGMDLKYCSKFEIGTIASNFKKVDLNGGYTSINLGFADKSAFNFDINTAYCRGLKVDEGLVNFSFREIKNTTAVYRGKYGKSSPKGTVNVTNKYGSVAFN